ncbi:hypothetical protein Indivirus_3_21 [Indivirus ILV1]|uniref:Uncharacterized protein n=1 Tax=Indivirus ILV1 TaxID=1977633 RepID=A0A1V0SDI3_9VIRU|nr:hypothetical protein Indivirus_3_21 [Indivirus ILV1]
MGLANSSPQAPENRKYTSAEIEQNLMRLFKNNMKNNFSEASQTFGNVNFSEDILEMQNAGNPIKFKSSKNRHLEHNIEAFINKIQNGGNENLQLISEQSEFAKIKEYLLKEAQTGGNNSNNKSIEDGITYESISSISGFNELRNSLSQEGGKRRKKHKVMTLAHVLQSGQLGGDRDDDSDEVSTPESGQLSETSKQSVNLRTADLSSTSENGQLSETSKQSVNLRTADLSSTSYSNQEYSHTSNQVESSELNIVPFYSSESSNAHPYTRNRLNK